MPKAGALSRNDEQLNRKEMRSGWNQVWGAGVIIVGIVWIVRQNVPVGIQGRSPSFYIQGRWATLLGVLTVLFGVSLVFGVISFG